MSTPVSKQERIAVKLHDPAVRLYSLFLKHALPTFDDSNTFLQREEPAVHIVLDVVESQLKLLLMRFVKPSVIVSSPHLMEVEFSNRNNQVDDDELFLGFLILLLMKLMVLNFTTVSETSMFRLAVTW